MFFAAGVGGAGFFSPAFPATCFGCSVPAALFAFVAELAPAACFCGAGAATVGLTELVLAEPFEDVAGALPSLGAAGGVAVAGGIGVPGFGLVFEVAGLGDGAAAGEVGACAAGAGVCRRAARPA